MSEKRVVDQAFFHDECNIALRLDQAGQDKRLQNTHVICDKDARGCGFPVRWHILDFEPAPHGFERSYRVLAALDPLGIVIPASFGQTGGLQYNHEHLEVEKGSGLTA
jgi:hypothetical protein